MDIRPLDAGDPAAMAAWHAAYHEATVHGLEHPSAWMLEEMRAEFLGESTGERVEPYAGYVDGRLVVIGVLQLPQMDNLDTANLEVATPPALRRRGHGTAMLEHLTALAARRGRRTLLAEASWDYHAPADGAGTPNADFLTAHGFAFSLGDVKRALDLPVDEALLDRLEAESAPFHAEYTLRHFVGPVPDDIIDRFGLLIGSLVSEAPMGDLDIEDEVYDATRIRADEKIFEASGRTKYTTVACAPDGELVAYTDLALPSYDPGHAYQWGTLVRPEHRGHRLGMAVKVRNLREFQAAQPGPRLLYTYNAEVNEHMIAVNDALGFYPVGRLGEFQKRL
jgi:GNAT superfamily N-acetyltransferase